MDECFVYVGVVGVVVVGIVLFVGVMYGGVGFVVVDEVGGEDIVGCYLFVVDFVLFVDYVEFVVFMQIEGEVDVVVEDI